jgi:two-component system osmolarity sensor histidine kinase EnvZ
MAASDTSHDARPTFYTRLSQAFSPAKAAKAMRTSRVGTLAAAVTARVKANPIYQRTGRNWTWFWRLVARYMPKRLYARSLIIVITPIVLLQSVVALVFIERQYQSVTQRLSEAVVRDIAAIVDIVESYPKGDDYANAIRIAQDQLGLKIDILPPDPLPPPGPKPFFSALDDALSDQMTSRIGRPFWLDTVGNSNIIEIRIKLKDMVLRVFARRSSAYPSNSHQFIVWMVGTSLVLLMIAIPFLRNQIRPILQLAAAAESFGKGRPPPENFRPRGAEEVRRAGLAFIQMRERIERQIEQRTAMLSGVSHDLRTILTRFRLQLALLGKKQAEPLNQDIDDMQSMLEGYLAFARGEAAEDTGSFDLKTFFEKLEEEAELRGRKIQTSISGDPQVQVRPHAFSRLLSNIVGNAFRYAEKVDIRAVRSRDRLTITVDDDGPGIPAEHREDVFRPFYRLDSARNQDSGGTGLGLSIARDVARSHGGDITLDTAPMGGLRAIIRVPA